MRHHRFAPCAFVLVLLAASSTVAHTPVNQTTAVAAIDGKLLIAAPYGLLRSDDQGQTATWICGQAWQANNIDIFDRDVVVFDAGVLLRSGGELLRSDDAGCSWQKVDVFGGAFVADVDVTSGVAWAAARGGTSAAIHRATAAGKWSEVAELAGLKPTSIAGSHGDAEHVMVAGERADAALEVRWSGDIGKSWNTAKLPAHDNKGRVVAASPAGGPAGLFVVVERGFTGHLLKHTGGDTWQDVFKIDLAGNEVDAFAWLADGATPTFYAVSAVGGAYRTTDMVKFDKLPKAPLLACLSAVGKRLYGCADNYNDGHALVHSDDGGQTWKGGVCLNAVSGPLACADQAGSCTKQWDTLVGNTGLDKGKPCGVAVVVPDAGRHIPPPADTGGSSSSSSSGGTSGGGSVGQSTAVKKTGSGCAAIGAETPDSRTESVLLLLLAAALTAAARTRRVEPCRTAPGK